MKKNFLVVALACQFIVGIVTINPTSLSAASDTTLPAGDFPRCNIDITTYCISEVTFIENGTEKPATWVASGTPTNDSVGSPNTVGFTTFGNFETNYPGRWSYNGFPISRKHDGIYVRAYAPNIAVGSDTLRIGIEPAGPANTPTGQVGRIKDDATGKLGSLDKTMGVRVKVRLGGLVPALHLAAAENVTLNRSADGTTNILTIQGTPTSIPIVSNSSVCRSADGKADALVNQMYLYTLWANGLTPFGNGGLSGDMTIMSNGFCSLSTPIWNSSDKTFDFTASAPHFAPNGIDVNYGFYRAVIPSADAKLLFGIESSDVQTSSVRTNALISASSALEVEITETDGVTKTFTKNVGYDGKNFVISALNFTYSSPKIRLRKGAATAPASESSGTTQTKPSAPRIITAAGGKGSISVTISAVSGVTYSATAKSGTKSVTLKCTKKSTRVTCASKSKLKQGNWSVTVTPRKNGVLGATTRKTVRAR